MVKVDFDQVDDAENFVSVPNGTYLCQLGEVRARQAEDGTERWGLRWIVADGPYAGRTAAWDSVGFAPRTLRRAKLILERLGVPVDGPQEIKPFHLEGKRAMVTVYARERVDPATGRRVISNRVPFAGIEAVPEGMAMPPEGPVAPWVAAGGAEPTNGHAPANATDPVEIEIAEDDED